MPNADASHHAICSDAASICAIFPFKTKKRVSLESYFPDIILEIGFFLRCSNPHCHLPRDNALGYKQEARVIVSESAWLSFHGEKKQTKKTQPFIGVT